MINFIQKGEKLTHTAGANYTAGDIIELTDRAVIACHDVDSGDDVEVLTEGVVELPKNDEAMTFGQGLYGDETANDVRSSSSGAKKIGICAEKGGSPTGVATVKVKLGAW